MQIARETYESWFPRSRPDTFQARYNKVNRRRGSAFHSSDEWAAYEIAMEDGSGPLHQDND